MLRVVTPQYDSVGRAVCDHLEGVVVSAPVHAVGVCHFDAELPGLVFGQSESKFS